MKRLSLFLTTIFLVSLITASMIGIVSASQSVTIAYTEFNSATATTHLVADYNDTFSITIEDALTWNATTSGRFANLTFVETGDASNYFYVKFNDTYVIEVKDENGALLYEDVELTDYIYINVYDTYLKLKTDKETSWVKVSHPFFNFSRIDAVGGTDYTTAGNVKVTLGTVTAIDLSLINSVVPIIVSIAVISMVIKMITKMTDKMTAL